MLKFLVLALAIFGIVNADVSHLSAQYLPPAHAASSAGMPRELQPHYLPPMAAARGTSAEGHTMTTIEKQELHELPEQIEYMQSPHHQMQGAHPMSHENQMPMPIMTSPVYLPPMPVMHPQYQKVAAPVRQYLAPAMADEQKQEQPQMEQPLSTPSRQYLAPAMNHDQYHPQQEHIEVRTPAPIHQQYLAPTMAAEHYQQQHQAQPIFMMSTPSRQYLEPQMQRAQVESLPMPTMQYLAPEPAGPEMPAEMETQAQMPQHAFADRYLPPAMQMPQPTYQQYQEQLMREHQMQLMLHAMQQMEMPPQQSGAQMHEVDSDSMQVEAQPAHILAEDGYHYKSNNDGRRLRLRS